MRLGCGRQEASAAHVVMFCRQEKRALLPAPMRRRGGEAAEAPPRLLLPGHNGGGGVVKASLPFQGGLLTLPLPMTAYLLPDLTPGLWTRRATARRKAPLAGMRDSRGPVLTAGLVGLAVGAGVCYCVYRVASQRRGRRGGAAAATRPASNEKASEVKPASLSWEKQQLGSPGRSLLQQVSGMSVLSSTVQKDCNRLHQAGMDLPKSPSGLEAHHIQNLINLLESTEDPTIQEQALITLGNCAAFSRNHDIIRNVGGLSIVGKMLWVPITKVKEKALNALNNLSMNIKNQEKMKIYITKVCEDTDFASLDSELQLAGLRFLTNMSVTNDYQDMMASSIPCFLHLLLEGNERTQIQVLKVLVNLSANPAMTEHLLNAQAPFLLSLFDSTNSEVLLRVLVFATNLSKHMKKDKSTTILHQYNEDSVFSVLWGNSTQCAQKLASLLYHHDTEIKEQVAKLIMQQC